MANRPAFELKPLMVVYNFCQVFFNSWLFYELGRAGWFNGYSWVCQPVDYSMDAMAVRMATVSWWYLISKFFDFFDTFFFVLRKKNDHISVLHLVHHGVVPMSIWPGVRFLPGGQATFFAFLNTLVHIVMYFYYMLAAMGPRFTAYLWWKKYLTTFQIVQFILATVHICQILIIDCSYPKASAWWIAAHEMFFLVLFSRFFRKAYAKTAAQGEQVSRHKKVL